MLLFPRASRIPSLDRRAYGRGAWGGCLMCGISVDAEGSISTRILCHCSLQVRQVMRPTCMQEWGVDMQLGLSWLRFSISCEQNKFGVVWVYCESCHQCLACFDSPCPKDEISWVVGCCGVVFFVILTFCVKFDCCCIYFWDDFWGLVCSGIHDPVN